MTTPQQITDFWLRDLRPEQWYKPDPALDADIRDRFMIAWIDAPALTAEWASTAEGALAALILTDQFPRNMFRKDARAFATDPLARRIARAAIEAGQDRQTPAPQRQFFYMPLEHSEDMDDQRRAVTLFGQDIRGEGLRHAQLHHDTIAHFGRFPWRNADLDRISTPEEQALLDAGGYGALVSGRVTLAEGVTRD